MTMESRENASKPLMESPCEVSDLEAASKRRDRFVRMPSNGMIVKVNDWRWPDRRVVLECLRAFSLGHVAAQCDLYQAGGLPRVE